MPRLRPPRRARRRRCVAAVQEAVGEGRRLVVTSGGHCLEGFVSDPDVRVIVDVSPMKRIYHDAEQGAIAVEAGATVGETFRALFEAWGTVIPLGEYPGIGMGGHVVGRRVRLPVPPARSRGGLPVRRRGGDGGRGRTRRSGRRDARRVRPEPRPLVGAHRRRRRQLRRRHALLVPLARRARRRSRRRCCRARRSRSRRSTPSGTGADIDRAAFLRLLQNHGAWSERNSGADSPNASLWTLLEVHRKQFGTIVVRGVSTAGDAAERQIGDYLAAWARASPAPDGARWHGCRGSSSP